MQEKPFDINSLRVASPCLVGWETMTGDERVRHCSSCQLNIYNTSEMTAREVEQLIERREGRLCIRLRRRADGTVITKDCSVGLREYRKRLARSIGATLSLIFGLTWTGFSQQNQTSLPREASVRAEKIGEKAIFATGIKGTITDQNGAVIPNATIALYEKNPSNARSARSDANGNYTFSDVPVGTYIIETKATGFKQSIFKNVQVIDGKTTEADITLMIYGESETVGIYATESLIDTSSSTVQTTITLRKISLIPHQ